MVVEAGDVLIIQASENFTYGHLNLPRPNFIIKRGGIANYKSLTGLRVKVREIKESLDGNRKVVLERTDGLKFLRCFPVITANLDAALKSGELLL